MPKPNTPVVRRDGLHLQGYDNAIPLSSVQWVEWLQDSENKSFRFEGESVSYEVQPGTGLMNFKDITFTAFKSKNGKYWNAQKRVKGTLRGQYIGGHEDLTYERLTEIGLTLNSESYYREGKKRGRSLNGAVENSLVESCKDYKTKAEVSSQVSDEVAQLKAELERVKADRDNLLNEYKTKCKTLEDKLRHLSTIPRSKLTTSKSGDFYQLRGKPVMLVQDLQDLGYSIVQDLQDSKDLDYIIVQDLQDSSTGLLSQQPPLTTLSWEERVDAVMAEL